MPREAGKLGVAAIPSIPHHDSCSPSDPRGVRASLSHLSLSKLSQRRGRQALGDASKSPGLWHWVPLSSHKWQRCLRAQGTSSTFCFNFLVTCLGGEMLAPCMEELVNGHVSKAGLNIPCHTSLPLPAPSTGGEHLRTLLSNRNDVWPCSFLVSTALQARLAQTPVV